MKKIDFDDITAVFVSKEISELLEMVLELLEMKIGWQRSEIMVEGKKCFQNKKFRIVLEEIE